jgi:hypothetical protein
MEARAADAAVRRRAAVSVQGAAIALMFSEVPMATDRLALCLRTQRRIGAAHALLHFRRLVASCLREEGEARRVASALAQPLEELDDALAADRLDAEAMRDAERALSFVRFQLWWIEQLHP